MNGVYSAGHEFIFRTGSRFTESLIEKVNHQGTHRNTPGKQKKKKCCSLEVAAVTMSGLFIDKSN